MEDMNADSSLSEEQDKFSQELANNLSVIEHKIEEKRAEYNKLIDSEQALTNKINNFDLEIQEIDSRLGTASYSEKARLLLEEYNEKDQLCKIYILQIEKLQKTIEQTTLEIAEKGKKLERLEEKYLKIKAENRSSNESQETLSQTPTNIEITEDQGSTISNDDELVSQEIVKLVNKNVRELTGISNLKELVSNCKKNISEKEKLIIEAKIRFAEKRGELFKEVSNKKKIAKENIKSQLKKKFSVVEVLEKNLEKSETWIKDHIVTSNLIDFYRGKISDLKPKIENVNRKICNIKKKRQRLSLAKIERQTEIESIEMEIGMAKAKVFEDLKC
ncbi:unnamed protein product [Blepharisma stoltei]|uniref:DUF4201 domain-containing protein n=1 Tax=Blepharisma stoltei TaxID=1481888 RepID=A0AAU9IVG1_9CILI|nr:unnamed protein product [Blepharisma stoltei]